jgi:predicted dehydrogenase
MEHAEAIERLDDVELTGFFDVSQKARTEAERIRSKPAYGSLNNLLHDQRPDVVIVATPPRVRLHLIEQIVQSDAVRGIVIEKPLALTLQDARQIRSMCDSHRIAMAVCYQLRFSQEFVRLKEAVEANQIGEVQFIHAGCYGNLFNQGPHIIDMAQWLMDARPVQWIMAQGCDEPRELAQLTEIPADFSHDKNHPAPLFLKATLGFEGGVEASNFLTCDTHKWSNS